MAGKYRKTTQVTEGKEKITVYVSLSLFDQITKMANQNKRSRSSECVDMIEKYLSITFKDKLREGGTEGYPAVQDPPLSSSG